MKMKRKIRLVSIILSAVLLVSSSALPVGAAVKSAKKKSVKAKTVSCTSVNCKKVKSAIKKKDCDKNCVVKTAEKGNCASSNCGTKSTLSSCKAACESKTVSCTSANCKNVQSILKKMGCDKNCNVISVLKSKKGYCPSGNCVTKTPPSTSEKETVPEISKTDTAVSDTESAGFKSSYEDEVIKLVNEQRANYGLSPLSKDNGASKVARVRAKEIVKSFSHTRPNGSSCFTAASELGVTYRSAGENIAFGYSSPKQVVNGWMNSEGHRKNILSASFTKIGVGCYESSGVLYWSQFFIG